MRSELRPCDVGFNCPHICYDRSAVRHCMMPLVKLDGIRFSTDDETIRAITGYNDDNRCPLVDPRSKMFCWLLSLERQESEGVDA